MESQGKVIEKSGNFEKDIEWQPWYTIMPDIEFFYLFQVRQSGVLITEFSLGF